MSSETRREKLAEFFRTENRRLVRYVQRLIDDTAERDGEDIVQDVALNLFNRADISVPIENMSAYIYRSLRNRVVDYLRKRKGPLISLDGEVYDQREFSLADMIHDYRYHPGREIDSKQIRQRVFAAIESLPDDQKAIIIETEFEGHTFRDLSEKWGIPIGTLLARKSRALKKIRGALSDLK
jgi:RNA polymerase sigma-70 factor (ECF subfamily)